MATLPMFPLGTVLLPGAPLQLQVFEPRYQSLLVDCLAGDGTFGVVLIERGHEVGGGDERAEVGTVAQIVRTGDLEDGRSVLLAIGTRRLRVVNWSADDPYPRADVVDWPDESVREPDLLLGRYASCTATLRHVLALATELGQPCAPSTFDAPVDPIEGSFVLSALAPIGPFDAQRLLCAADPASRLGLLESFLVDLRDVLEAALDLD